MYIYLKKDIFITIYFKLIINKFFYEISFYLSRFINNFLCGVAYIFDITSSKDLIYGFILVKNIQIRIFI